MIKKGSFITSADKIAKKTGVPRGTVERIIKYLKNEVMIEEHTTRKFRLISVVNYDDYQNNEEVNEEQVRNKRGTSEEQVDTANNTNNYKELIITKNKSANADDIKLSDLLLSLIIKNIPTFKKPNLEAWYDEVRKMRELDNRTYEQIEYIIKWCQSDSFWQANILSMKTLRKQFDKLVAQVKREKSSNRNLIIAE